MFGRQSLVHSESSELSFLQVNLISVEIFPGLHTSIYSYPLWIWCTYLELLFWVYYFGLSSKLHSSGNITVRVVIFGGQILWMVFHVVCLQWDQGTYSLVANWNFGDGCFFHLWWVGNWIFICSLLVFEAPSLGHSVFKCIMNVVSEVVLAQQRQSQLPSIGRLWALCYTENLPVLWRASSGHLYYCS